MPSTSFRGGTAQPIHNITPKSCPALKKTPGQEGNDSFPARTSRPHFLQLLWRAHCNGPGAEAGCSGRVSTHSSLPSSSHSAGSAVLRGLPRPLRGSKLLQAGTTWIPPPRPPGPAACLPRAALGRALPWSLAFRVYLSRELYSRPAPAPGLFSAAFSAPALSHTPSKRLLR